MVFENLKRLCRDESGAITADFVILTAVVVSFGMGVLLIIAPGIGKVTSGIEPVIQSSAGLAHKLIGNND